MTTRPAFIVSLDLELHWGLRDIMSVETYVARFGGERDIVMRTLDLFAECGIHATWAAVGFLFFSGREELLAACPAVKPCYLNRNMSPYDTIAGIGDNESQDPHHFGRTLIKQIANVTGQEIGTHTFSHYYCLEPGQNEDCFRADLQAAQAAAASLGLTLQSIVFPRNQFNPAYLAACAATGIRFYRGPEQHWFAEPDRMPYKRAMRLLDSYVPVSGHNSYAAAGPDGNGLVNVASSRFLRTRGLFSAGSGLLLRRILSELTFAARERLTYHLWWHPFNLIDADGQSLHYLRTILRHVVHLNREYGMESLNMREWATRTPGADQTLAPAAKRT